MEIEVELYLDKLASDIQVTKVYEKKEKNLFFLPFGERNISIHSKKNQLIINAEMGTLPDEEVEPFCQYLLFANYLGQGTGNCSIGLRPDKQTITLTRTVDKEVDYLTFKEVIEEFVNYLDYWKDHIEEKKGNME